MHCPFCGDCNTSVVDSRVSSTGDQVRRRRECLVCNKRYTTYETAELNYPAILKTNKKRQPFDAKKLRKGLLSATEGRPIGLDKIDGIISIVQNKLRASGKREVPSKVIGDWVMSIFRGLDDVAYIRFASVYKKFTDIDDFIEVIQYLDGSFQQDGQPDLFIQLENDDN